MISDMSPFLLLFCVWGVYEWIGHLKRRKISVVTLANTSQAFLIASSNCLQTTFTLSSHLKKIHSFRSRYISKSTDLLKEEKTVESFLFLSDNAISMLITGYQQEFEINDCGILVIYCRLTNYYKTQQLKTINMYFLTQFLTFRN